MDNGNQANFELDQFNLDTNDTSWDYSPERDARSLGNTAISSTELDPTLNEAYQATLENIPDFAPAPLDVERNNRVQEAEKQTGNQAVPLTPSSETNIDLSSLEMLRESKDRISEATVTATEKTVSDFEKGKITPAELVDLKWEATKAYLKNSFGRELE